MKVNRIVANVTVADPAVVHAFYKDLLGLELAMDHGWIRTYTSTSQMSPQISFASQGGSDTAGPDLSIEVDDLDEALRRMRNAGVPLVYGPVTEGWGVRRFFVRDPLGKLINILQHQ